MARTSSQLDRNVLFLYGAIALGPAVFMTAINSMIPQLYAKELGLDLTKLGVALLAIRVMDTFADQLVGYLSDRTRTRFGSRKPWVFGGVFLTLVGCFYLFTPPASAGIGYFVLWRCVYDVGWTMYYVPYNAWGAELSSDYGDRSRINGASGMSTNIGVVVKNLAPIALFWMGISESSAFTLEMFSILYWIWLPIVAVLTLSAMMRAPLGTARAPERTDIYRLTSSLRGNKPFWIYFVGFLLSHLGTGVGGLLFTFYDSHLKLGSSYPYLMLGFGAVTVAAIPAWVRIANTIGKHKAYGLAMFVSSLAFQAFWLVDPAQMSQAAVVAAVAIILTLISFSTACMAVAPAAILADVVDYATWRTRIALAGSYFAFHSIVMKLTIALGSGIGFILLDFFHYQVKAGSENTPSATSGLLFTVLVVPGILHVAGGAVIWYFPLDKRRHDVVKQRLAVRRKRETEITERALLPAAVPRPRPQYHL